MNLKRIIKGVIVGGVIIFITLFPLKIFETSRLQHRFSDNLIYKLLYSNICLIRGDVVSGSKEHKGTWLTEPHVVCDFEYDDIGEECYDNNDCGGACVLKHNRDGVYEGVKGTCQRFKSDSWCDIYPGLSVERKDGKILNHSCPIS